MKNRLFAFRVTVMLCLLSMGAPANAQYQYPPPPSPPDASKLQEAKSAIEAHPAVKKRLSGIRTPLAWTVVGDDPTRDCFFIRENHPTHMSGVETYCRVRATGVVLIEEAGNLRPLENLAQVPSSGPTSALPGPATSGWFIVMGTQSWHCANLLPQELARQMLCGNRETLKSLEKCAAAIVASNASNSSSYILGKERMVLLSVTKRFGPFPSIQVAGSKLQEVGWNRGLGPIFPEDRASDFYFADSGC